MSSQEKEKNYREEEDETEGKTFICNMCQHKAKKESTIKSHMTQKHKPKISKKVQDTEEDDPEGSVEADMLAMAQWDKPSTDEPSVEPVVEKEQTNEVVVIDDSTGQEGNLGQAVERIKALEEELSVKEEVIKKVESELETARDAATVATAESASLEDEKATLKTQLNYFRRVGKSQMEDIQKMQAGGPNPDLERKLKEVEDQLKIKTKTIEGLEKSKKELAKKVEEEVSARAKAEADASKFSKMVDILQQCPGTKKDVSDKPKIKCRDVGKSGGCPRAGNCTYFHPNLAQENKNIDCHHWMSGKCKFSEKNCKFKHNPEKKESKMTKRKRSENSETDKEASQQDFLISLVKALTQGSTGEARMGRQEETARGMEGERNTRRRMVSPSSPSRGMDGQKWDKRSYANATDASWRREEQERSRSYRYGSPSRVQEEQEPRSMEQLRGMVRNITPAHPEDQLQEGIQLLMQLAARQSGRK